MLSTHFFSELLIQLDQELPFVAYRKPNDHTISALLMADSSIYQYQEENSGFIFSPFNDSHPALFFPLENAEQIHTQLGHLDISIKQSTTYNNEEHVDKKRHVDLVFRAISEIKNSELKKVVVSRKESCTTHTDPLQLFKRLLQTYPTAFVYCWYHPNVGLWLGATPETLLQVRGSHFKTMALAGTQAYKNRLDVEWGVKEIEEQQLVSDYILNSIAEITRDVNVSEAQTVKAGNLLHLQTNISGFIKTGTSQLKQLIEQLHPTPAVCGLPRDIATKFIFENEGYSREFYTGFLGELNMKTQNTRNRNRRNVENNAYNAEIVTTNLYVNLRCVKMESQFATIFVGGGITAVSDPELEWLETVHKAQTIKSLLS